MKWNKSHNPYRSIRFASLRGDFAIEIGKVGHAPTLEEAMAERDRREAQHND